VVAICCKVKAAKTHLVVTPKYTVHNAHVDHGVPILKTKIGVEDAKGVILTRFGT
jgi:hypothetical protein